MSTCSGLSAIDHANDKYSKGYATTGIVCTTCRHEFVLPEGAGPLQKGERLVFGLTPLVHHSLLPIDMRTPTMWSFEAHPTTLKQKRLPRTILCASGASTSESASSNSHSKMQNVWMIKLLLVLFRNSIWPPIRKIVASNIHSIMSLVLVVAIWRDQRGRGSVFKGGARRGIKGLVTGVTRWMTSLATGTGPNLFASVSPFHFPSYFQQLNSCSRHTPREEVHQRP